VALQAVNLADATWQQVGPDLMMTGYLPSSGGLLALERACSFAGNRAAAAAAAAGSSGSSAAASGSSSSSGGPTGVGLDPAAVLAGRNRAGSDRVINFYKAWDEWGCLSNFSPHPISMPEGPVPLTGSSSSSGSEQQQWASVEHFYQSQKFTGVGHADAAAIVEAIAAAESPEEAARIGRQNERQRSELVRSDWAVAKRAVMLAALRAKFNTHTGPRQMLLSTADASAGSSASSKADVSTTAAAAHTGHQPHQQQHYMQHSTGGATSSSNTTSTSSSSSSKGPWGSWAGGPAVLVENSPHDRYWGQGYDGLGQNHLGQLLMQVRQELLSQEQQQQQQMTKQPLQQQQQQQAGVTQQHLQQQGHSLLQQRDGAHHHLQQQQQQSGSSHIAPAGGSSGWQQQRQQQDAHAGLAS
jgi:ribA/ribD-fused uncharacterized protein